MEACRIGIVLKAPGVVDVGAPMKYKELCYEMLTDAVGIIAATNDEYFSPKATTLTLVMDMSGRVDLIAPLPPRQVASNMLVLAKDVIERFNDDKEPELRPFNRAVMGEG